MTLKAFIFIYMFVKKREIPNVSIFIIATKNNSIDK
jgi:hypothetical protein